MKELLAHLHDELARLHDDEEGVAITEYVVIVTFCTIFMALGIFATGVMLRDYYDFLLHWLNLPIF